MDFILEQMKQHKKQNLPFVVFRKPNSKTIVGVFQENDHVYFSNYLDDKGFVFAPFQEGNIILFPLDFCKISFGTFKKSNQDLLPFSTPKVDNKTQLQYTTLVQKGVKAIHDGLFNKVVLSRTERIAFDGFKTKKTFERMLLEYPSAYCYCWFHPKIGLWMGATPEKLLQANENKFTTMALAGTQSYAETLDVEWGEKERLEQEFVIHFIVDQLQNYTSEVTVSSPYTTQAGHLLHLKTDIEGTLNEEASLIKIIDILHPTPAVCGLPKDVAMDFILENEGYDREFYTGFLGELNCDYSKNENVTDLYVNLRCMKIKEYEVQLFMGCGITKDSDPELEWEETVNKSEVLKKILLK